MSNDSETTNNCPIWTDFHAERKFDFIKMKSNKQTQNDNLICKHQPNLSLQKSSESRCQFGVFIPYISYNQPVFASNIDSHHIQSKANQYSKRPKFVISVMSCHWSMSRFDLIGVIFLM